MRVQTILNQVQKQRGFVYGAVQFVEARGGAALEVAVRHRAGRRPTCSGCGQPGPGYDTLPVRQYEFVPVWGLAVFFAYARRRVDCRRCGVFRFALYASILPNLSRTGSEISTGSRDEVPARP